VKHFNFQSKNNSGECKVPTNCRYDNELLCGAA